jgi:phosphohistidine phosphatase SixA
LFLSLPFSHSGKKKNMRELILLRHAHAEPVAPGQSDTDRPLSSEGLAEAEAAGRWLAEQGLVPDRVLCSPSRRTRETLEAVLAKIGYVDQRLDDAIYDASAGTLAEIADGHREAERLLLVGHNPGIEHLAALMHSGQSGDFRGMPPGGIAVLSLPADAAIEPGIATLSAFWWP